jgi:hypothetical protein
VPGNVVRRARPVRGRQRHSSSTFKDLLRGARCLCKARRTSRDVQVLHAGIGSFYQRMLEGAVADRSDVIGSVSVSVSPTMPGLRMCQETRDFPLRQFPDEIAHR